MPATSLQQQIETLRAQLDGDPPLRSDEREAITRLIAELEVQQAYEHGQPPSDNLVDGVNLAVERFEVSHPTLAGTLRNIMQSLANMGI